jgi:hypothetical protein
MGLLGNTGSREDLESILHEVHDAISSGSISYIDYIKQKPALFKKAIRVELEIPEDPDYPYRYHPIRPILPIIDPRQIFQRFANVEL